MSNDNSGLIVDALRRTDPQLAASIDANDAWRNGIKKRGARVKLYRDYERGDHRADMLEEIRKMLRLPNDDTGLSELNVNYCKIIIDKFTGRLFVSHIETDNDQADSWLSDILAYQDFDAQQSEWYRGAARDGDAFVMIDSRTLRWVSEPAYDGFDGMVAITDSISKRIMWACKLWSEADIRDIAGGTTSGTATMRVIVYQPGGISYWKGQEGGNTVDADNRILPENASEAVNFIVWPMEKLPIVFFGNQRDNFTSYGESELRVAVPLQDSLNSIQHDKTMASKLTAFKQYWAIGMEIDPDGVLPGAVHNMLLKDSDGNIVTSPSPEQLEFLKAVRVGEFGGADITQYTGQIEKEVQQISQVTQTPIYGVTTQGNLSGEALKQLEIGLLGKVERFQHQNTDAVKELIQLTAEMQGLFDIEAELPQVVAFEQVRVIWKPAEILNVNERILALLSIREKAPGLFSDDWLRKRIGSLLEMSQDDLNEENDRAATQTGFNFDLFTAASNEQAA